MQVEKENAKWSLLAITSLGHLVNDGSAAIIPIAADIFVNQGHVSLEIVTLMSLAFYSSSAALSFFVGNLADRKEAHGSLMGLGIALFSLSFILFYASSLSTAGQSVTTLAVLGSVIAGSANSFYHPLGSTIIQNSFSRATKGKALGVNGAFGAVGSSLFAPLFFWVAAFASQEGAFVAFFLIGIGSALTIWVGVRRVRTRGGGADKPASGMKSALTRGIIMLTLITAVRSISTTGFIFWLPTYVTSVRGAGVGTLLGLTLGVLYVGAIPGQMIFGMLSDRFDKRLVLGVSYGGAAMAIFGYLLTDGLLAIGFLVIFGLFSFSIFPTLLALTAEYVPSSAASSGSGMVWGLGATGGNLIGPALVGLIIGNTDGLLNLGFTVVAIIGLVGALMTPFAPDPNKAREQAERGIEKNP